MLTNTQFVGKLKNVTKYKTLYVMGCFGAPMTSANKQRYTSNHSYNKAAKRVALINNASADTFGFDCVCLIKAILWGWRGDASHAYGGASYASNNVPDINADSMISNCVGVSSDFSRVEVGEAVWVPGHIGVYIGNNQVIECTPEWSNCVQITNLGNTAKVGKYRVWKKHGKLPYIKYSSVTSAAWTPAIGDIVDYNSSVHYASADAKTARLCKGGKAVITNIYKLGKSRHPYHLVRVSGSGATVHGWVDEGSFTKLY